MLYKVISMVAVLMVPPAMGTLYGMTQLPVEKPRIATLTGCSSEPDEIWVTRGSDKLHAERTPGTCIWVMDAGGGDVYGTAGAWDIDYSFFHPGGPGTDSSGLIPVTGTYSAGSVVEEYTS